MLAAGPVDLLDDRVFVEACSESSQLLEVDIDRRSDAISQATLDVLTSLLAPATPTASSTGVPVATTVLMSTQPPAAVLAAPRGEAEHLAALSLTTRLLAGCRGQQRRPACQSRRRRPAE